MAGNAENVSIWWRHHDSLRPSDAIWRHHWFMLAQVMACCLTAPIHYLNQWWLDINGSLRNKLKWNWYKIIIIFFKENAVENVVRKISNISPRSRCVTTIDLHCSSDEKISCYQSKRDYQIFKAMMFMELKRNKIGMWINLIFDVKTIWR